MGDGGGHEQALLHGIASRLRVRHNRPARRIRARRGLRGLRPAMNVRAASPGERPGAHPSVRRRFFSAGCLSWTCFQNVSALMPSALTTLICSRGKACSIHELISAPLFYISILHLYIRAFPAPRWGTGAMPTVPRLSRVFPYSVYSVYSVWVLPAAIPGTNRVGYSVSSRRFPR